MSDSEIVIFSSDMMSSFRIESGVKALGFSSKVISSSDYFGPGSKAEEKGTSKTGEATSGVRGVLIEKITRWQPSLLIFDMAAEGIPWSEWVASIKSSPATRNIPVICFGPHVDIENFKKAEDAGADLSVPRSKFFSRFPNIVQTYSRVLNMELIRSECDRPLSLAAVDGLKAFNAGKYFEAHEHLEEAWNIEAGVGGDLYRGILQVAVAYLQIERGNYEGAVKMFLRSRQWLNPIGDICRGIDIPQLKLDKEATYTEITALGPRNIGRFDTSKLQPVKFLDES